jgi:AcrR family transcriptional regulator
MTADARRRAIIDATVAVMLRKGMAATTVRDVAEQMGSSSGLIHHYFESMDGLLAAAFDAVATQDLDTMRAAMAACEGPVEQLAAFFSTYSRADQEWTFQLWLDAWSEAARRPAVRETSRRQNVAWQQLLARTIRAGEEHHVMSCADPEAAAWRILSLLDGLVLQTVAHRLSIGRDVVVPWAMAYAETELGMPAGSVTTDRVASGG